MKQSAAGHRPPAAGINDDSESGDSERLRRLAPYLILAWVLANYLWTLPFGFTNDDFGWVYGASHIHRQMRVLFLPPLYETKFVRPLMQFSLVLNYLAGGTNPVGYRLFNILAHAGVALLLWRLALRLRQKPGVALAAALVFAVHPTRTDAVVWISGRTELLCALGILGTVVLYLAERRRWALLAFVAALASKETAVCVPLLLVAAEALRVSGAPTRNFRRLLPYLAILAAYLLVRLVTLQEFAANVVGVSEAVEVPLSLARVVALARSKVTLIGAFAFSPLPAQGFLRSSLLLVSATFFALFWTRRRPEPIRAGARYALSWAAITLTPYLGWAMFQAWYVYLPVVGTSLTLAIVASDLLARTVPAASRQRLAAVLLLLWLGASVVQLQINNERERRGGDATRQVAAALAAVVPPFQPATLFVADGLGSYVFGLDPALLRKPILVSGLTEAVRMLVGDDFIDVEFGDQQFAEAQALRRPVVFVEWQPERMRFRRVWEKG